MTKHSALLSFIQPRKLAAFVLAVICLLSMLGLSNSIEAQLVFDKSDIDGSFGQGSVLNAGGITYAMQPFFVANALVNANAIQYSGAFSAQPVTISGDNQVPQIDVRTWDNGLIFISTAEDLSLIHI